MLKNNEMAISKSCLQVVSCSKDFTRGTVQKSICVLSTLPLYGQIQVSEFHLGFLSLIFHSIAFQVKMSLITEAYFREGDFSRLDLIHQTYDNLVSKKSILVSTMIVVIVGDLSECLSHRRHASWPTALCWVICSFLCSTGQTTSSCSFQIDAFGTKSHIFSITGQGSVQFPINVTIFALGNARRWFE